MFLKINNINNNDPIFLSCHPELDSGTHEIACQARNDNKKRMKKSSI